MNEENEKNEKLIKEDFLPKSIPSQWHIPAYFFLAMICGFIIIIIDSRFNYLFIRRLNYLYYKIIRFK